MYKCIHKPIHHTQTPKMPRALTDDPVWEFLNHHVLTFAKFSKLAKHLEKHSNELL